MRRSPSSSSTSSIVSPLVARNGGDAAPYAASVAIAASTVRTPGTVSALSQRVFNLMTLSAAAKDQDDAFQRTVDLPNQQQGPCPGSRRGIESRACSQSPRRSDAVRRSASGFMNVIRPARSVAMTASPMLDNVAACRRCAASARRRDPRSVVITARNTAPPASNSRAIDSFLL